MTIKMTTTTAAYYAARDAYVRAIMEYDAARDAAFWAPARAAFDAAWDTFDDAVVVDAAYAHAADCAAWAARKRAVADAAGRVAAAAADAARAADAKAADAVAATEAPDSQ